MGLDTTHDAWHGAYSSFAEWRNAVAQAGGYTETEGTRWGTDITYKLDWEQFEAKNYMGEWDTPPEDPLLVLLVHSDCEGFIPAELADPLANRLSFLLDALDDHHRDRAVQFITGLREAVRRQESVRFH